MTNFNDPWDGCTWQEMLRDAALIKNKINISTSCYSVLFHNNDEFVITDLLDDDDGSVNL